MREPHVPDPPETRVGRRRRLQAEFERGLALPGADRIALTRAYIASLRPPDLIVNVNYRFSGERDTRSAKDGKDG